MKNRFVFLMFVLAIAGASVAWGGGAKQASGDVTLKFTFWGSPIERQIVEQCMASFEKANPGIKVDAQHIPDEYTTKILTMIAGNVAPDILYVEGFIENDWGLEGRLVNIFDLIREDPELNEDDFMDLSWFRWAPGKSGGTLPAIEPYALFYNKDMFLKAGLQLPPTRPENAWTWDQYVDIAKKLTLDANGRHPDDPGFDPNNIVQYGTQYSANYINAVYSNNGRFITADGKRIALTSPEAIDAIQKLGDLMNVHHVAPTPVAARNIPEISTALMTERVAMVATGQWVLLDLAANDELNWDIGVLPKLQKYVTVIQGGVISIMESSKNKAEAWKLYKWFNNAETIMPLHAGGLWMPSMKKWYTEEPYIIQWAQDNKAHPPSFRPAVLEATLKYGMPMPTINVRNFSKIENLVNAALDQVWLGEKSAAQALREVEPQINSLVEGFYDTTREY